MHGGGKAGEFAALVFPVPIVVVTGKPVAVSRCRRGDRTTGGAEADVPVVGA